MFLAGHIPLSSAAEIVTLSGYSTANDGIADATSGVAAAISAATTDGSYLVHTGKATDLWLVTSFSNPNGVEFEGQGKIITAINSGYRQLNSNGDRHRDILGREYLSCIHKRFIAGTGGKIVFSGDSTTAGTNLTTPYYMSNAIPAMATKYGVTGVTGVNSGFGGEGTALWLSSHLATDLSSNPDLYVVRWGINDPYLGLTAAQTISNIRSGLATCRASKTKAQMSIILMMPNATTDNSTNRDERYYEALLHGFRQAAREYGCVFFNTYGLWRDAYDAADWMGVATTPGNNTRYTHPADVEAMWINSMLSDLIFPTMLRANG